MCLQKWTVIRRFSLLNCSLLRRFIPISKNVTYISLGTNCRVLVLESMMIEQKQQKLRRLTLHRSIKFHWYFPCNGYMQKVSGTDAHVGKRKHHVAKFGAHKKSTNQSTDWLIKDLFALKIVVIEGGETLETYNITSPDYDIYEVMNIPTATASKRPKQCN